MIKRPRIFFGWYLVGFMIVSLTLIYGIRNAFSVLFDPILDEFGWYRGSTALMLSIRILIYGTVAPIAGSLVDRWKPRKVAFIGILLLSLSTLGCAFANQLWHFYLLFGVLSSIGATMCGSPVLNPMLINWFTRKRGLAMGLGQIGGGLSFTYGMLVETVISHWEWRVSFGVIAALPLLVLLPLYFIFLWYRPEEKGLKSYGIDDPTAEAGIVEVKKQHEWTLRKAFKTPSLWWIVFANLCFWGIGNYLVLAHQIKFAVDVGYSSTLAASVFALFGLSCLAGQIGGAVSDKIGREKTITIAVAMAIGALVALLSVTDTSQPWRLYVYAIFLGISTGMYSPTIIVGMADIFHGKNIGAISGMVLVGMGIGGSLGPWLGGHIHDITGSYTAAFTVSLIAYAVAGIAFWLAAPRNAAKIRARMEASE